MESALIILLSMVASICLLGGMNLLIKGAGAFLPKTLPRQPIMDNLFRFLSGLYFGLGFLMVWVVFNVHVLHGLIYFIGIAVTFSGLGRLYSKVKVGSAGTYFERIMILEIALGITLVVLQHFSDRVL